MLTSLLAAVLTLQAAPTIHPPMPDSMTQQQQALLRCAAAFAVVSNGQANGDSQAQQWPELGTRGREFFVRAMAQLMDQTGLDREGISLLAGAHAQALSANGEIDRVMPACLTILESSGI
jgi:hypothetical protein